MLTCLLVTAWFAEPASPATAASPAQPAPVPSAQALDRFLAEFVGKRDAIKYLKAPFSQVNTTPDERVSSSGRLVYAKPRRIVFRYETPEPSVCLIDGLRVFEYDVSLKQVQIFTLEDDPETEGLYLGFESDLTRLQEAYEMELFTPGAEFPDTTGLVLRPKPRSGHDKAGLFERVHLYLRNKDLLPVRIYIVNDPESQVDIRIHDCVVNGPVDPRDTQLDLPEGVRIVEDDVVVETVGAQGKRIPEAIDVAAAPETQPAAKDQSRR